MLFTNGKFIRLINMGCLHQLMNTINRWQLLVSYFCFISYSRHLSIRRSQNGQESNWSTCGVLDEC